MITLTESAKRYMKSVVYNGDYVSLSVKGGGCSGMQYVWGLKYSYPDVKWSEPIENLLVVDDINGKDSLSIWNGPRFKALRKQHLDDKLSKTLCANCIRSQKIIAEPINKKLHAKSQKK